MRLIDEVLPEYHVRSRHARPIDAPPDAVAAALRGLEQRDLPLMRALMEVRGLPRRMSGRGRLMPPGAKALEAVLDAGFTVLGEREHEIVVGTIGQFWRPVSQPTAPAGADEFVAFAQPGYAKGVMDFVALPMDGGSVLATETRVLACDERSRERFERYWALISLGSGLIRRELLTAVARRAGDG